MVTLGETRCHQCLFPKARDSHVTLCWISPTFV